MLPVLYKETKIGAIQSYLVTTDGDTIIVSQGQVGGKKQAYYTKCTPKNIGKANETTAEQQAILEATSKHEKKIKSGYTLDPSGAITVELPMKVKTYQNDESNVPDIVFTSPKLNGLNGEYRLSGKVLKLFSRGGLEYKIVPHHVTPILTLMRLLGLRRLSGELYIHGEHLQDITAAVKKHNSLTSRLEFHIFDLPGIFRNYAGRAKIMRQIVDSEFVKAIPVELQSKINVRLTHDYWVAKGYEGIVINDPEGYYEYNIRSSHVWKFKIPKDAEFKVIDYLVDKNSHPVLVCKIANGKTFKVKPKGTAQERVDLLKNIKDYLGMWYKVEFETLSKANIPLKPVGVGLRMCDKDGNPLE